MSKLCLNSVSTSHSEDEGNDDINDNEQEILDYLANMDTTQHSSHLTY